MIRCDSSNGLSLRSGNTSMNFWYLLIKLMVAFHPFHKMLYMWHSIYGQKRLVYAPAGIYLLKVNNGNIRTICEICSKLTIKTPEQRQLPRQWHPSGVFIVNFKHISHIVLVFPLLTLNKSMSVYWFIGFVISLLVLTSLIYQCKSSITWIQICNCKICWKLWRFFTVLALCRTQIV